MSPQPDGSPEEHTVTQPSICTGASDCPADPHIHGCYADRGSCDAPKEHRVTGTQPSLSPTVLRERLWEVRVHSRGDRTRVLYDSEIDAIVRAILGGDDE